MSNIDIGALMPDRLALIMPFIKAGNWIPTRAYYWICVHGFTDFCEKCWREANAVLTPEDVVWAKAFICLPEPLQTARHSRSTCVVCRGMQRFSKTPVEVPQHYTNKSCPRCSIPSIKCGTCGTRQFSAVALGGPIVNCTRCHPRCQFCRAPIGDAASPPCCMASAIKSAKRNDPFTAQEVLAHNFTFDPRCITNYLLPNSSRNTQSSPTKEPIPFLIYVDGFDTSVDALVDVIRAGVRENPAADGGQLYIHQCDYHPVFTGSISIGQLLCPVSDDQDQVFVRTISPYIANLYRAAKFGRALNQVNSTIFPRKTAVWVIPKGEELTRLIAAAKTMVGPAAENQVVADPQPEEMAQDAEGHWRDMFARQRDQIFRNHLQAPVPAPPGPDAINPMEEEQAVEERLRFRRAAIRMRPPIPRPPIPPRRRP